MRNGKGARLARGILIIAAFVGAFFFMQEGPGFCGSKKPSKDGGLVAPPFTLESMNGGTKSLKDYKGKVVLLDFWSINCPPCRRAVPHVVVMYDRYRAKGFVALGISFDGKEINNLRSFVAEYNVDYPILLGTMDVARAYGVRSIPSIFLLDRAGHIRLHRVGFNEEIGNEIEDEIKVLLKGK